MTVLDRYKRFEQLLKFDCKTSTQINSAFVEGLEDYKRLAKLHTPMCMAKVQEIIGSDDVINGMRWNWYLACPNCEEQLDGNEKICLNCTQLLIPIVEEDQNDKFIRRNY